jgi:dolichol-phosphate mannosyltransferase
MEVLVVLPTYNEADNVEEVLRRTRAAVPDAAILVVDDNSPDGTADLAEKVGGEMGGIDVMRRPQRLGLGTAYGAGFEWGLSRGAELLVSMDSDLQHDPGALPTLLSAAGSYGLVIGSRYVEGGSVPRWAWHRRLLSAAGNRYAAWMLRIQIRDLTSGYRVYRADTLSRIHLDELRSAGYGFQIEMAYRAVRAGVLTTEVPIRFDDRELGESKMSPMIVVEAMILVTRLGIARRLSRMKGPVRSPSTTSSAGRAQ